MDTRRPEDRDGPNHDDSFFEASIDCSTLLCNHAAGVRTISI